MNYYEEALKLHEKHQGKIHTELNCEINTMDDMSVVYTPGVAEPCRKIAENEEDVYRYTTKSNTIAVVSNGTAVLGLGNIGAKASIPVMEGKAALFKKFGDVNAVPICLDTQDKEELIQTVKNIAPCFGGINLEDIASPDCFEIEERLDQMLDIPVFHDDQHGTAVVVLAALYNALRVTKKDIKDITVVLNGPGAAGTAIIKMMHTAGVGKIIAVDEFGILYKDRQEGLIPHKRALCDITNPDNMQGTLADALKGADVFVGVSKPNLVTDEMVHSMNNDPIIFAMANPEPEITYQKAKAAGARVVGTGRSDYPNQVNNLLAFPGIFRGALDVRATDINEEMKIAAAYGIAELIPESELTPDYVIPAATDRRISPVVASFVAKAAIDTGIARRSDMTPEMVAEHTRELLGIK